MAIEGNKKDHYPAHNIDPKLKDKKWCLQFIRAFYSDDRWRGGSIFYQNRGRYERNLKYSLGQQDIEQYKEMLGCDDTQKSWINTNWANLPILPKFVEIMAGNMSKQKYNIECNPIDPTSVNTEKQAKYNLRAKVMLQSTTAEVENIMGIQLQNPEDSAMDPKTLDEIDLHMRLNYKNKMAIAMEEGLTLIHEMNDWSSIESEVDLDLIRYGVGAIKDFVGKNGLPECRRVNPYNFWTMYSKTPNFKRCGGYAELETMTIAEFEKEVGKQFTKEEKKEIYDEFSKMNTNLNSNTDYWNNLDDSSWTGVGDSRFGSPYDDYVIQIFDAEFISTNTDYYEIKTTKHGNKTTRKKKYGYKSPKNPDYPRETKKDNYSQWYKGKWIVGTEFIYDTGLVSDQKVTQSSFADSIPSYHVIAPGMQNMNNKAPVDVLVPMADDIQINVIQLRRAVARARAKGLIIEVGSLENVIRGKGGEMLQPLDLIAMSDQTGNVLYRKHDDEGKETGTPITEIENGMARDVFKHVDLINVYIGFMRDASGINEVTDASSPDPDMLKGIAELAVQGTNNAMRSLYDAKKFLFTETAYSLTLRVQESVKKHKMKGWAQALGKTDAKFIEVNKDISMHEYGFVVEDVPTDKEMIAFEEQLNKALGDQQITIDQYFVVESITNLKLAQQYLQLSVKRNREETQAAQQQNILMTGEEQRKSAAQTHQLKKDENTHETDNEIRLEMVKGQIKKDDDYRMFRHEASMGTKKHHEFGDLAHVNERVAERAEQRAAQPPVIVPTPAPSEPAATPQQ